MIHFVVIQKFRASEGEKPSPHIYIMVEHLTIQRKARGTIVVVDARKQGFYCCPSRLVFAAGVYDIICSCDMTLDNIVRVLRGIT